MNSNKAKAGMIFLAVIAIGGALYVFNSIPRKPKAEIAYSDENQAFDRSRWGMSMQEVQRANQIQLIAVQKYEKYYTPKTALQDPKKLEAYQDIHVKFLGRPATVTYLFFNNKLFQYHVFIQDSDGVSLEADLTQYLTKLFGSLFIRNEDGPGAHMLWQKKDRVINGWVYEDTLRLSRSFSGGYGVVYEPIEKDIR